MKMSGAQIVVECLVREKVDIAFGIPGGMILPIFDKLYGSPINFILARHEQGAAHMADGYARSSGKTGVCIATSGPGATNLVTGLATAYMDSVPMVAITGQVATTSIGNDAFQEADTTGITRPVTKHNFLVRDVNELALVIRQAFHIASTGRPGPVLVDIPVDVQRAETEFVWPEKFDMRSYQPTTEGHPMQIKRAAEAVNAAQRPVLYIGGGVISSGASAELTALANKAGIPVTTTLLGMGAFPHDSPLYLGMLGMHGLYWANHAIQNADLIISVGARFDDRCTGKTVCFGPKARIVHIDIDPTSIAKSIRVDIPVVGDARSILAGMIAQVKEAKHDEWLSEIDVWRKRHPLSYANDDALRPQYVIERMSELTRSKAIVVTDVGQHQMWAAQFNRPGGPRSFLSSGGLGTMGYGFPAGIGAKFANPDTEVVIITGDGSFQMNLQELAVTTLNDIKVTIILLNNLNLGMVRQWQDMFYDRHRSASCLQRARACPGTCTAKSAHCPPEYVPNFVKLAEAYGAMGIRVDNKKDVDAALKKALASKVTTIVEFMVEESEDVLPMVPSGKALDEVITRLA